MTTLEQAQTIVRRGGQFSRRRVYQIWHAIEKAKENAFDQLAEEEAVEHLDNVQDLHEVIFHLAKAGAHLAHMSKHQFGKMPEELEGYK